MAQMNGEQEYKFDEFIDGSDKLVGELHLVKMKAFIDEYSTQLQQIENALDESLTESWDSAVDPIFILLKPYENTNLLQLVKTDNKVFNKVILAFCSLAAELNNLKEQASHKFFAPFRLFGEIVNSDHKEPEEGDIQIQFGKILPLLLDCSKFVKRCNEVVKNLIHQFASLYNQQKLYTNFKTVHLQTIYEILGDLLGALITIDEIVLSNDAFNNYLNVYKRMVKAIKNEPSRYNVDEDRLWQIEKMLYSLKGQVLDGRIFQNCIEQEFDFPGVLEVTQSKDFKKEFFMNIRNMYTSLNTRIGDQTEMNQRNKFLGLCSLYVFYVVLYKDPTDKKFFRNLWDMHKKVPILHLYGDVTWNPTEFFNRTIPMVVKLIGSPDGNAFRKDYIKVIDKEFQNRVKGYYLQVSVWMVRMESNLSNRADIHNIINTRIALLTQGLGLAYQVGHLFKEVVYLHLSMNAPLKTGYVRYLCQCVEMLKAIQATFQRRMSMIAESISFMTQQLSSNIQKFLYPVKAKLEASGIHNKKSDAKLDSLAAVTLAIQMLTGVATKERRLILKLCLHVVNQMTDVIREEELEELRKYLSKLETVCDMQEMLYQSCDCSFLYWSRSMIPAYFMDVFKNPQDANKLQYIFAAFKDVIPAFNSVVHITPKSIIDIYMDEVYDRLKTFILDPLCREIETDLRLHIHQHLAVSDRNPWKDGLKDLARLTRTKPMRFFDRTIDISAYVSHYLDTTFYNLTTVALHDWKTYGEMRNLAAEKYGLKLTEVHLPSQTLEQGIDVLEIMRNIHIFVGRFSYNLNNQIFIEKSSDSKTLNTINLNHIANSIRTHGVGIMNTTVNFIFQFLKQKFVIFSQFLYDDHIKSRLYRDIRYFKDSRDQLGNKYPYERAQKFNKEIRKLGLTEQKLSYLDQFRNLITEIGNAMGYIRMIRSGGFLYVSNAIRFVPDLQEILSFEELVKKENLSAESIEAAKNLDHTIDNLSKNFAEGTEYFKMLVSVFAGEFRSQQNIHLKNFFIIVPPLTINYIEHILQGKEKLQKKKPGGFFTDDGFAIGVAYILKLLDQYKYFDSLHWFEEVITKYIDEQRTLGAQLAKARKEDQQTGVLTQKKLRSYQNEFELLRFSFEAARIFFKD